MSSQLPKSFKPKQTQQSQPEPAKSFPKSFKQKEKPSFASDENLERDIERNQAQFTSRMIERLLGTPGDIYQFLPEAVHKVNPLDILHKHLPTSQQLRGLSEKATGGYTKSQTEFEEKVGEFGGDVASFALGSPGKTLLGGLSKVVGIPLAGQLAKEGIEQFGGNKAAQQYGKLGTMLLLDLWGLKHGELGGGARKYGITRLEEAEKAIPKGAIADVPVLQKKLDSLEKSLKSGITGPHSAESLRTIGEIKGHIQSGKMEAAKFPQIRRDINKLIDNLQGFSFEGPPKAIKRAAVENLNQVKSAVIQAGNRWGRKNSPEFFKNWREGNEALSVFHKSNDIGRFFSEKTKVSNPVLKHVLGVSAFHHPVAAAGIYGTKKGIEVATRFPTAMVTRFFKSKVLRKLYQKAMNEALKGNSSAAAATIQNMEKEMKKEKIE